MASFVWGGYIFHSGDKVKCIIDGIIIENARIYVPNQNELNNIEITLTCREAGRCAYICQNQMGSQIFPNIFEYSHSWFTTSLTDGDGELSDGVRYLKHYANKVKIIGNHITYKGVVFNSGDKVRCCINRAYIHDAKVYIPGHKNMMYICQNIKNGDIANNKLGYLLSWSCVVQDNELDAGVTNLVKVIEDQLISAVHNVFKDAIAGMNYGGQH